MLTSELRRVAPMTTHPDYHQSPFAMSVPRSRPPGLLARFAYGTLKTLTALAALSGVGFSLYRNDVLLYGATHLGVQSPYLELERRLVGAPGWGTPRTTPTLTEATSAAVSGVPRAAATHLAIRQRPLAMPVRAATTTAQGSRSNEPESRATADGVTIVSVEALPLLQAAPATQQVSLAPPSGKSGRAIVVKSPAAPAAPKAAPAAPKAAPAAPKAAPAAPKVAPAAPKAAPAAPKAPQVASPAAATPNENPLKAAIRSAVQKETAAP